MQTKWKDLALDPKALQHQVLNLSPNRNLQVKIQSPLQQLRLQSPSSKTRVVLVSLRSCLTLFLRWRKAQKMKGPRRRKISSSRTSKSKESSRGRRTRSRSPRRKSERRSISPKPQRRSKSTSRSRNSSKRGLINGEREVDQGLRDATVGPGLILSEEANIQDPGRAPGELDQGLL